MLQTLSWQMISFITMTALELHSFVRRLVFTSVHYRFKVHLCFMQMMNIPRLSVITSKA